MHFFYHLSYPKFNFCNLVFFQKGIRIYIFIAYCERSELKFRLGSGLFKVIFFEDSLSTTRVCNQFFYACA